MDLLIIKEKVNGTKRKYITRYELMHCRKCALFRKEALLSLSFIKSVLIIPIEMKDILNHENI